MVLVLYHLIFSKLLSSETLNLTIEWYKKEFHEGLDDVARVSRSFGLLTYSIENGIIYYDVFELLKNVCNNRELKKIMDLDFITTGF